MSAQIKRERGDTLHDIVKLPPPLGTTLVPSETTQSSIKFEKCVYNTLLNLNNQMSSTLCGGVKDINDVCFKIMECLHEIEKQDKMYQKMRRRQNSSVDSLMPIIDHFVEKKEVASCTTMTEEQKRTQCVETDVNRAADQVVQCSFVCDVPTAFGETQSMQDAFKQCLQAFIKDVEDVSSVYLEEAKKAQSTTSDLSIKKGDDNEKIHSSYVFKCKAVHNLHEKLIKQVEACDSFCEFQKRMAHNLKVINGKKIDTNHSSFCCYHRRLQKATEKAAIKKEIAAAKKPQTPQAQEKKKNLASKYSDSLWFTWRPKTSHHKPPKKPKGQWKKPKLTIESTTIVSTTPPQQAVIVNESSKVFKKVEAARPSPPPSTCSDYDTWHQYNTGHLTRASKTLNCVDILEELTENDVRPIHSEYPRHDDDIPPSSNDSTTSFLHHMVYGRHNRNVLEILSSLEQPKFAPTPSEKFNLTAGDNSRAFSLIRPPSAAPVTPPSPNTDKFATKRTWCSKSNNNNSTDKFASAPKKSPKSDKFAAKKSSSVASAPPKKSSVFSSKGGQKGAKKKVKGKSSSDHSSELKEKASSRRANDKIASKLQKYINDPQLRYRTTITVMPVRVYHHPNSIMFHTAGDTSPTTKPPSSSSPTRKFSSPSTTPRDTTLNTRKMWANKYQKSVCQHLVSFIEKQEPHPLMTQPSKRRIVSKPRSAPLAKKVSLMAPARTKMLSSMGMLASIDRKGLETNIQRIIDMIELKIIDIISDPEKQNPTTFAEIEREITAVLGEMRAMGAAPAHIRKIRREDLKLTALETILDLEVMGDSVVSLLKKDTPKSQTTTDLLATSEDSVEEEKCIVTSACAPEKTALTTVSSQKFLTPFMQELKKHRQDAKVVVKKASYQNVIEFLDNLANIPDDCAIVLFYRDLLRKAEIWQQAQVFFLKDLTCPVLAIEPPPPLQITNLQEEEEELIIAQPLPFVLIATEMPKIFSDETEPLKAKYLNKLYGVLFTLMYFALTFDYDCA